METRKKACIFTKKGKKRSGEGGIGELKKE